MDNIEKTIYRKSQSYRRMSEESIFQTLRTRHALVDVEQGGLVILDSADDQRAIRAQLVDGDHCFVLMGTVVGSAISMAKIAAIDASDLDIVPGRPVRILTDVDYMVSGRPILRAYLKKPEVFQAPVAWLFYSNSESASCDLIRSGISKVLQHLHIELQIGRDYHGYVPSPPLLALHYACTVVAVRHQTLLSEVYVEECLGYPKVYSGDLTLVKQSLCMCKLDPELGRMDAASMRGTVTVVTAAMGSLQYRQPPGLNVAQSGTDEAR
jgi:hypothetical protein